MNTFSIVRFLLLACLIVLLFLMVIMFSLSIIEIVRGNGGGDHTNTVVSTALAIANAILGLLGAYTGHFLFTLLFAFFQTVIIIAEMFFPVSGWVFIPWIGSAVLAFVLAFMIKRGYTQG